MKNRLVSSFSSVLGIALFVVALAALRHELRGYSVEEILMAFEHVPMDRIVLAMALAILTYFVLTSYDILGFFFIKHRLPYRNIILTSFIGYALGNTVGFSALTCGSVRYRFYAPHGLTTMQILQVIAFASLSFWLGLATVGAVVFLLSPPHVPPFLHLPFASARPLGLVFLVLLASYLTWNILWRRRTFTFRAQSFRFPSLRLSLAQLIMASAEWLLTASVLYVLLPHVPGFSYPECVGIFLLAYLSGVASQVPGGLGVFESIVLALLPEHFPAPAAFASLLLYRFAYNVVPLVVATVFLGLQEISHRRRRSETA